MYIAWLSHLYVVMNMVMLTQCHHNTSNHSSDSDTYGYRGKGKQCSSDKIASTQSSGENHSTNDVLWLMTVVMTGLVWVQLVRDLCSWCGLRQVSRRTFVRALNEKGSVMLVPGGQAELVHTWRIKCRKEFVIYGRHKGQQLSPSLPS